MKQFNGYEDAKKNAEYTPGAKLPVGAYVCKVISVKYEEFEWGDRIAVAFDITEGEQKDFFKNQYENNTSEDKKWKGVARINVPKDDGSEQDGWTKNAFAKWCNAFEDSNTGYIWDWQEEKWKGKVVGIIFRECGKVIDNKNVQYVEVSAPCSVEQAREGTYWDGYTKFKAYKGFQTVKEAIGNADEFMQIPDTEEEELPF